MEMQMSFRACVMLSFAAAALPPYASWADQPPKRLPGLWEISETSDHPLRAAPTVRVCIDEATESLLNNINAITRKSLCSEAKTKTTGNVLHLETICEFRNTRVTTRAAITISEPASYHVEAQALYAPPLFGQREAMRKQDGKWIAPCPDDMKPGDVVADGAPKRNLVGAAAPPATPVE